MSAPAANQGGGRDLGVFAVVAILIVGLIWLVSGGSERDISRSAIGFRGMVSWLKAQDIEARTFTGGGSMIRDAVGLRILPLYDTDLNSDADQPETKAELIGQTTQIDITRYVVQQKIRRQPTLVVLPKWRSGMYLVNRAHEILLIPPDQIERVANQIDEVLGNRVRRDSGGWATRGSDLGRLGLFHRQTIGVGGCEPILGTDSAMLLGRCPIVDARAGDQDYFWILADPDLASNHGIRWATNAGAVAQAVRDIAGDDPVILDLTRNVFTVDRDWQAERRERTWEEFTRMFAWPFTMIWIAFGLLGALILWRAVTRYGPLARAYAEEPRAAKEVSIEAKARLLRLADHDTALLGDHFRGRLQHLCAELLGPHRPPDREPLAVLTKLIARRNQGLASELEDAARIPETHLGQAEILRRLDRFETCYDKVTHEFGRAQRAG